MKFNYDKLLGRIVEIYGNQSNFAKDMKLSERSISLKLNNVRRWKDVEIKLVTELLKIPADNKNKPFKLMFKGLVFIKGFSQLRRRSLRNKKPPAMRVRDKS